MCITRPSSGKENSKRAGTEDCKISFWYITGRCPTLNVKRKVPKQCPTMCLDTSWCHQIARPWIKIQKAKFSAQATLK